MSKVEELIKEKCPKGVEYKPLSDKSLFDLHYGKGNKIPEDIGGIYDVYGANGVVSHIDEYNCEDVSIIGHIGAVGMVNRCRGKCFVTYNGTIASVVDNLKVDTQYFYYVLTGLNLASYKKGNQPFLSISDFENIEIPVPPIEVQQEIVRILNKFTELEAELQAELDARKKQYEYYRDRLFVFKNNVEYKNILNVISMKARVGWQALTKKEYLTTGEYYLITGTDFREDGCIEFDSCVYVSEERYDMDDNIKVHVNDILMTKDGTLGKVAFMEQEPPKSATLNGGVYRLTVKAEEVLPKYIYHYFTSYEFKCFIEKVKTGGTIKHLTQKWFETLEVPVPPIKKQEEIVRILDTFSAFCNSRVSGLPAEIQARHKQYEYYRDKLLTFKRKEV